MPSLADIQSLIRDVVVTGSPAERSTWFKGGRHPEKRLGIHRRNYESGLVTALSGKFPGTVWLVGAEYVAAAAAQFAKMRPPQAPCIAEYGWEFPLFLASFPGSVRVPYLNDFAQLEWCVGQVSIAIPEQSLEPADFAAVEPAALLEASLELQSGLDYFQASWPVDDLLKVYLSDDAPERLQFDPKDVWPMTGRLTATMAV